MIKKKHPAIVTRTGNTRQKPQGPHCLSDSHNLRRIIQLTNKYAE